MSTPIAIVGATGLVGLEMRKIFEEDAKLKAFTPLLFASQARPNDKVLELASNMNVMRDCPVVLNGASSDVALLLKSNLVPGQILIDNSSAFRLDPEVPLIVPEVNGALLESKPSIIANPNCTAILLCVALNAIKNFGLMRVVVATYQAASGAGIKGLEELEAQERAAGQGEALPKPTVFPFHLHGNVLSHNTDIRDIEKVGAGYNEEEWKVIEETRKILDHRHLALSATCMRVPVKRAHTEAVTVDLKTEVKLDDLRAAFASAAGVKVVDDWQSNHFPMPMEAQNQDLVFVGRIRKDPALHKTMHFVLAGDQLRKGAASNAIDIMRICLKVS